MRRRSASPDTSESQGTTGLGEALAVWAMLGLDFAAIAVARGGRGDEEAAARRSDERGRRIAAFVRHPVAPAALPLGLLAVERLAAAPDRAPTVVGAVVSGTAAVAAAATFGGRAGRGTVASGAVVAAACGLTAVAVAASGAGELAVRRRGDGVRVGLGAGLLGVALPWLLADVGIYVGDLPGLGRVFLSRQADPAAGRGVAVHLGHHHGLDGALVVWTGLALSRQLTNVGSPLRREVLALSCAFFAVYGTARVAEDAWHEQIVKRGWARLRLPSLVERGRPTGAAAWAVVFGVTAVVRSWLEPSRLMAPHGGMVQTRAAARPVSFPRP